MLFTLPLHAFVLQQHNPTKNKTIRLHKAWLLKSICTHYENALFARDY
jgi:hypothetical protein